MIRVNLIRDEKNIIFKKLSRTTATLVAAYIALASASCTTFQSSKKGQTDGSLAEATELDDSNAASQQDIPAELRNASRFDPAMTLDPKVVKESDFYQIKQSIQQNKEVLEAAWKEQEAIEARVQAALSTENQRKAALAKQEEEERERKRQLAAEEYEKTKELRAKDEEDADRRVKKMPTINRNEELWNGLED